MDVMVDVDSVSQIFRSGELSFNLRQFLNQFSSTRGCLTWWESLFTTGGGRCTSYRAQGSLSPSTKTILAHGRNNPKVETPHGIIVARLLRALKKLLL